MYLSLLSISILISTVFTQSSGSVSSFSIAPSASSNTTSYPVIDGLTISAASNPITASLAPAGNVVPTGSQVTYPSYSSTITLSASSRSGNSTVSTSSGGLIITQPNSSAAPYPTAANGTTVAVSRTSTSSSARPSNTQPCNGYVDFCDRSYSNITNVCAHNSPFTNPNNAARNQDYGVITQLNDGIRMLQSESHYENNTIYMCHTSCNLLNAGTLEAYLTQVAGWVKTHPYDLVTILLANSDFVWVTNYTAPMQNSGLGPYLYTPPKIPMGLGDWPTLAEIILTGKRVIIFMDYMANQQQVPYILDQYSQMWETPFSPTDRSFPCTTQRPPGLSAAGASSRMYLANHNLNVEVSVAGLNVLVPNTVYINQTNGVSGFGSLGAMTDTCTADWNRPPNFLVVDFYNQPPNGSVFEVAAKANNVTYNGNCCGTATGTSSAGALKGPAGLAVALILAFSLVVNSS